MQTGKRKEIRTIVTADVGVEVWIEHEHEQHGGVSQSRSMMEFETRKLKVSLTEQLESSSDIREAFARLAEIAVQGAARASS